MIMRIAERSGVRDHQAGISHFPEGPLVRPADPRDVIRHGTAVGGEFRSIPKLAYNLLGEGAGFDVADEGDEVPRIGIEEPERRQAVELLAPFFVAVIADGLQAE